VENTCAIQCFVTQKKTNFNFKLFIFPSEEIQS